MGLLVGLLQCRIDVASSAQRIDTAARVAGVKLGCTTCSSLRLACCCCRCTRHHPRLWPVPGPWNAGLLTQHLTVAENVIVQTTAVATATMPLAAGAPLLLL